MFKERLSQKLKFWESNLRFMGKSGLQAAFSRAVHKTNRVLGTAHESTVKKPFRRALILRSAALFAILYQFRLLAADLADTPVFLASLLAAFGTAFFLGRPNSGGAAQKHRPLGPLSALAAIALIPWALRFFIALPRLFVPGTALALDSLLLNLDRNSFVSLFPFYWAAVTTWFSIRSRNFLRGDIIAGAVLLLVIYSIARAGDIELYRWPVFMIAVFGGIVFLQLGALLLSLPPAVKLRKREALPAALTLLLLAFLGGLLFLRPSQERAIEKGGGLLEPKLFRFDFSQFLRLESEISMKDDLVLILKKDAEDDHILFRRYVLSGYSEKQGFFRREDMDEAAHPQRQPDRPLRLPGKEPFTNARITNQEFYLVNFDTTAFIAMNDPFAVTPYENWDTSSFSSAYGAQSYTRDFNPFELINAVDWPLSAEKLGLSVEEYRIYTEYGGNNRIAALAGEITGGFTGYWEKVQAVFEFLKYGEYRYSLKPGIAHDGDQLGFFLFTSKKGYCSYYAFSMALLLRSLGIPARVAAGFFIDPSTNAFDYYPVRSDMAHAWVEVPFPGYGWVEYDPTTDQLAEGEEFRFSSGVDQNLFERLMREILENHDRLRPKEEGEAAVPPRGLSSLVRSAGVFLRNFWPPLCLFFLALLFLFLRCGPLLVSRLTGNPRRGAIRLWRHTRRRLALGGRRKDPRYAEAEWARELEASIPGVYALYQGLAAARYAPEFTPEDLRCFRKQYLMFSTAYRKAISPGRRLLAWVLPPLALILAPGGEQRNSPGGGGAAGGGKNRSALILLIAFLLLIPGGDKTNAQNQEAGPDRLFNGALDAEKAELWERAIMLYTQGREQYPQDPRFPLALGNLYYYRDLYSLAWDEYRRTERLLPGSPDLLYRLSRCAGYLNRDRLSVDYLEQFLAVNPDNREAIGNLGWMYYKVHRLEDGERLLIGAIERLGEDSDFAMTLGTLYSDMFRYEEAKKWYQKAIAAGERLGDRVFTAVAHYNLSILETRFNRFDLALKATNDSLESQNRASGRLARGELFLHRLDLSRALGDYEAAYEIDTSPLAKINLAQIYQISGRLEEARLYAEDCLKTGDLSWMLNYGIDPVRYQRDIRDILYKTYAGLAKTEKLTPYGRAGEKIRSWFRRISYRFKAAVNRKLYQKYSLAAGNAYGIETREGKGPHLDASIQYYNAFESYPRRARGYLAEARSLETSLIPEMKPSYDLEEGILLRKKSRITAALEGFDPVWERDMIARSYVELSKRETGTARRAAAAKLFAMNQGFVRQQGIKLPVEFQIRFSEAPGGLRNTGRIAKRLTAALKKAGFETAGKKDHPRFSLTISVSEDGGRNGAMTGTGELYDREREILLLNQTLPIASPAAGDLCDFTRILASLVFHGGNP
jgi:tetratricopeptide (TPR) repeat protein